MELLRGYQVVTEERERALLVTDVRGSILNKISTRQATVAVIGLGYVGLPLGVALAESGLRVVGIDIDARRVSSLNAGQSYIPDVPAERLSALLANTAPNGHGQSAVYQSSLSLGSFYATTQWDILHDADAVIICVPTPVSDAKDPDLSYIVSAVDEIAPRVHQGMLVVLESTTYPGTTEEVALPRLEQSGLKVGVDFFLAFSPERIDPGRTDWTVRTTPKVVGGMTPACLEVTCALYACAVERVVPVSNPKTAEMVKLLENTFRAVNIGLANEMAIMCDYLDIDVWEVIEAARSKPYGFMPFYPGPGLGGHCIPVDPLYLSWKLRSFNYNARFIQAASEINLNMPHYVRDKIAEALNEDGRALNGSRVVLLGVAYKPNVGDVRESPALDLIHLLRERRADVVYHDPYVPSVRIDGETISSIVLDPEALLQADCVVIATDHDSYDWTWIVNHSRLVVDTRNATQGISSPAGRVVKL